MHFNVLLLCNHAGERERLAAALRRRGSNVLVATSEAEALRLARSVSVDAVLIESSQRDAAVKRLREKLARQRPGRPVLLMTSFAAVRQSLDLFGFGEGDYLVQSEQLVEALLAREEAQPPLRGEGDRAVRALIQVLDLLVGLLELDDRFFGGFSHQVMRLTCAVGEAMGLDEAALQEITIATLLRDIGKAGVDHAVLLETSAFTPEQAEQMRKHVEGSVRLLEHIDFPWKVLPIIRHHHERYDGRGYPDGLKGREIPLGARIISVVEAYMAMLSDRPHRPALTPEQALAEVERHAGTQFDPEVVEVLIRVVHKSHIRYGREQKAQVLLADSQAEFQRLLKMRLLNEGFEVLTAETVDEASKMLCSEAPELVLVELGLGGGGALELLRRVRDDEEMAHLPVVVLSDTEDRLLKLRALRLGADDWLLKTEDLEELVVRVENILAREAARRGEGGQPAPRGITGDLENLSLPDIVQILTIGVKTARVTLTRGKEKARIWFRDGQLVHAELGPLRGEEAFYGVARWQRGRFAIEHNVEAPEVTIEQDAMYLLMEALRRMDEESADAAAS